MKPEKIPAIILVALVLLLSNPGFAISNVVHSAAGYSHTAAYSVTSGDSIHGVSEDNQGNSISKVISADNADKQVLSDIRLCPNPARGTCEIVNGLNRHETYEISVLDVSGKTVLSGIHSGSESYSFDMRGKHAGIYYVRAKKGSEVTVKRLVLVD